MKKWLVKAIIQKNIANLPRSISYPSYYWIQRNFGSLKTHKLNPTSHLSAGIEICNRIKRSGQFTHDSIFLEIGTGRRINVPLAFWLLGAKRTYTIDLNVYLKEELIREDLSYVFQNWPTIKDLFGDLIVEQRLKQLFDLMRSQYTLSDLFELISVQYIAPGDASKIDCIPSNTIDFHTSYTVLEHIHPETIKKILLEGRRLIKDSGLFIHKIDYSDHFSHFDKSISAINFLKYSETEWSKIAGNRFMYMNRLRHDDFMKLLKDIDFSVVDEDVYIDSSIIDFLSQNEIYLDPKFSSKSINSLATISSWLVLQ
jgi:hypothetical protein